MALHPYCTFRGVTAHLTVQFTLTHGIAPNQCTIEVPPTDGIEEGGDLVLHFGGTHIVFPDCKVDRIDVFRNPDGLETWTLTIFDRRWKWKECGAVSGYFNVRDGVIGGAGRKDGIRKGTEKGLRDLMKICLEALGETGYDTSQVRNDLFPEIEWDYALPANALASLADIAGCRVMLKTNSRVAVLPAGIGKKLTRDGTIEYQLTVDPPERPDKIIFRGARILWEQDLELEAVARLPNGEWVELEGGGLPYQPTTATDGVFWAHYDEGFANTIPETPVLGISGIRSLRELAKADVFRKYRVKVPFDLAGAGEVRGGKIDARELISPLLNERIAVGNFDGKQRKMPAVVWGVFSRGNSSPEKFKEISDPSGQIDTVGTPNSELTYHGGWSLDAETLILSFGEPVFRYGELNTKIKIGGFPIDASVHHPAQLWLRTSFGARKSGSLAWTHFEVHRQSSVKRFGTQPRYLTRDDISLGVVATRGGRVQTTIADYKKQAKFYLDEADKTYATKDPCAATYPGIVLWELDGAIQQVTWLIGESGATTRVSRNREEPIIGYTYAEQRYYQQLSVKLTESDTARAAADKLRKRPA